MRIHPLYLTLLLTLATSSIMTTTSHARTAQHAQVQPVVAPASLTRARAVCPVNATRTCYLTALRHAYESLSWQKSARRRLHARLLNLTQPVPHTPQWTCIHHGEGAWSSATGNGYHGGLQMDDSFERAYGQDMLRRYGGHAELWTPRDQMIVAERAYESGRGFQPWPNTARACGLL